MRFKVLVTTGGEIKFEGAAPSKPIYYGGPKETGLWRIDISKFEQLIAEQLKSQVFGDSIEEFDFSLEIANLDEWGNWFKATKDYVSYRPKSRRLISVGQIEWDSVKKLDVDGQWEQLTNALRTAVGRIASMKRKPSSFDFRAFGAAVDRALTMCSPRAVAV